MKKKIFEANLKILSVNDNPEKGKKRKFLAGGCMTKKNHYGLNEESKGIKIMTECLVLNHLELDQAKRQDN